MSTWEYYFRDAEAGRVDQLVKGPVGWGRNRGGVCLPCRRHDGMRNLWPESFGETCPKPSERSCRLPDGVTSCSARAPTARHHPVASSR